jgi:ketosteroid isomerase-like protein
VRVEHDALGRDHESAGPLRDVAFRDARESAVASCAQKALRELRPDVLASRSPLEPHRVVALAFGIAEAVERHAALPAEVEGGVGPVLEDRDDVRPGRPELLVVLTQLGELFAAERSAEVAHEGHYERPVAPALGECDLALARLEVNVREPVALLQHSAILCNPLSNRDTANVSKENVEIVRRCIDLFNSRDISQVAELLDPEIELDLSRNVFNPDVYRGHAGIERWRNAVEDVWDDFQGVAEELIEADNKVVAAVNLRGKGKESGVEVKMQIFSIWTLRDSKVVQVVGGYRDRSEVLEAAGL